METELKAISPDKIKDKIQLIAFGGYPRFLLTEFVWAKAFVLSNLAKYSGI